MTTLTEQEQAFIDRGNFIASAMNIDPTCNLQEAESICCWYDCYYLRSSLEQALEDKHILAQAKELEQSMY